jgi:transcriptional regulator with XRE-family HTH domain
MEQMGLTRNDLIDLIGSRGRVSEVLNRRRPLTVAMIVRLREKLGISADVLKRGRRSTSPRDSRYSLGSPVRGDGAAGMVPESSRCTVIVKT